VVVIESDPQRADDLQSTLDALVITGNGASPATLEQAGAPDADLLIAVSNSDGVNALSCHAGRLLGVGRTVARIEDPDLLPGIDDLGIDVVIDPGEMAAHEVVDLVRQRGISDLVEFAEGSSRSWGASCATTARCTVTRSRTPASSSRPSTGPWVPSCAAATPIPVRGETRIAQHDHVLLISRTDDVARVRQLIRPERRGIERVIVMGATRVAELATDMLLARGISRSWSSTSRRTAAGCSPTATPGR
jgi:trk system potassium uptake protein